MAKWYCSWDGTDYLYWPEHGRPGHYYKLGSNGRYEPQFVTGPIVTMDDPHPEVVNQAAFFAWQQGSGNADGNEQFVAPPAPSHGSRSSR